MFSLQKSFHFKPYILKWQKYNKQIHCTIDVKWMEVHNEVHYVVCSNACVYWNSEGSCWKAGFWRAQREDLRVHAGPIPHVWGTLTKQGLTFLNQWH